MKNLATILILSFLSMFQVSCKKEVQSAPVVETRFEGILKNLQEDHPRLLLTEERLNELKTLSTSDRTLWRYASDVISLAEKDVVKAPIQHILIGPRLLDKSRECLSRVYDLAFAFRWTGNIKYYNAALSNLKTVCAFADWNPSHFLDVAEMTHAVAIGYDWLYNKMDQASRDEIKAALIKLGLNEGKKAYADNAWWTKVDHNWNQVCNSGLLIGALAIAETDTALSAGILRNAIANLPYALKSYGPDGVWGEGPGYWEYATDYTSYGMAALQTSLKDDFGLTETPGMRYTGYFPIYSAGPTGLMLNYADAGEKSKLGAPHPEMWLANVYTNTHFSDFVIDQLKTRTANAFDIIWYQPRSAALASWDLDKFFDGKVALFFSRSSWTDVNSLWVGFKAGYNQINHAHLDLGNFEMDALGVRWARDLGSDDYNLPGYFSGSTQTSQRWTYYRTGSSSHNIPVLNGQNQSITATSQIIKHGEGVAEPFAVVDFTKAYADFASSALRGIKLVDSRKAILVQDEFTLSKPAVVVWGITTDATITIVNPQQAELTIGDKKLTAWLLSPVNATFQSQSAQQAKPQMENMGVNRLLAKVPETTGNVTVSVLLSPQWPGTSATSNTEIKPLAAW